MKLCIDGQCQIHDLSPPKTDLCQFIFYFILKHEENIFNDLQNFKRKAFVLLVSKSLQGAPNTSKNDISSSDTRDKSNKEA